MTQSGKPMQRVACRQKLDEFFLNRWVSSAWGWGVHFSFGSLRTKIPAPKTCRIFCEVCDWNFCKDERRLKATSNADFARLCPPHHCTKKTAVKFSTIPKILCYYAESVHAHSGFPNAGIAVRDNFWLLCRNVSNFQDLLIQGRWPSLSDPKKNLYIYVCSQS